MGDIYNSKIAALVGWLNKAKNGWAVTISKSTTLYSKLEAEVSAAWRAHEDEHKRQWREDGFVRFGWQYLKWNFRHGYNNNQYEVEAEIEESKHK